MIGAYSVGSVPIAGGFASGSSFKAAWARFINRRDEAPEMLLNTASQSIGAQMVSASDGSAFTGSVTVYVTGDSGTQAVGSVGSGLCTHEGNGYHSYRPSQSETNYAHIAWTFTGAGAIPQTIQTYTRAGDPFTRLGAPVGASISADIAALQSDTDNIQTRIPSALVGGRMDCSVGAMASDVLTGSAIASSAVAEIQSGLSTMDASAVRTAIGLASANLDSQLTAIDDYIDSEISAIKAKTDQLTFTVENKVDVNVVYWKSSVAQNMTGDAFERLGPPIGGTVTFDIAELKIYTQAYGQVASAIKVITDKLGTMIAPASGSPGEYRYLADALNVPSADAIADEVQTRTIAAVTTVGTVAALAANSVNASALATDAVAEIQSGLATSSALSAIAGYVDTEVASIKVVTEKLHTMLEIAAGSPGDYEFTADALRKAPTGSGGGGGSGPSAAEIADAVWDEIIADHNGAGSTGAALAAAGGSGDPWATALPGAYSAGTAGQIIGDYIDAAVSTRATQTSVDAVDTNVDAILVDTGTDLPATLATISGYVDTEVAAVLAAVDTEVAAIKAKTDNLPSDPADASDITAALGSVGVDVDAIRAVTDKLDTTMEAAAGSPGDYRFTADALETAPTGGDSLTAAAIADAVWDEAVSVHTSAGTFGKALGDADDRGARTVVRATVGSGSTTTSIVTSAFSPAGAAADQFKGRIVIFDNDTATAELRGQASDITASSNAATPTLTVTAFTTAPSSGDTFSVV